jgi:hypothetical protein
MLKTLAFALAFFLMLSSVEASRFLTNNRDYELTISCTAREARRGDIALVFGYFLKAGQVMTDIPISLLVNEVVLNATTTSSIGSYIFVLNITENLPSSSTVQTRAYVSGYGSVSSILLTLSIGTTYKTHSNSDLDVYPDIDDEIYRSHSLIVDNDGTIHNKTPFNYNSWLLYGFGRTAPDEPLQESFSMQGGMTKGRWWNPELGYAALQFSTLSNRTYNIFSGNVSILKVGNISKPVQEAPAGDFPSVWLDDPASPLWISESINLAVEPRQYFIKAYSRDGSFSLEIVANGTGFPFWIARRMDNMFVALYPGWFWGAYVQFTSFSGTIRTPATGPNPLKIEGIIEIDREWHAPVMNAPYIYELENYYTALGGIQTTEDAMFTVWQAYAPRVGLPLSQSGKIVLSSGKSYPIENFELTYGGDYYAPDWYRIRGTFGDDGVMDVYGTVLIKQTYYINPEKTYGFNQPYVKWSGRITGEEMNITVDAEGMGESTRIDGNPPDVSEVSQEPEPQYVEPDDEVTISANITDLGSGVREAILSYFSDNKTAWENVTMNYNSTTALYEGIIPKQPYDMRIEYKIIAYDNAGNRAIEDNAGKYYIYQVIPEFSILWPLLIVSTILMILTRFFARKEARLSNG